MDLTKFADKRLDRMVKAIGEAVGETDVQALDDLVDQIDQNLLRSLDLSVDADIKPWIGQYVGLGITDIKMNSYGEPEGVELVLAVEARNTQEADRFVQKLTATIASQSGQAFAEQDYQGVKIYLYEPESEYEQAVAIARSGNAVLLTLSLEAMENAIDAQKEQSIGDDPAYTEVIKKLPRDRAITFYMSGDLYLSLFDEIMQSGNIPGGTLPPGYEDYVAQSLEAFEGFGMSVAVVDAGLQMDVVGSYDLDKLSPEMKVNLKSYQGKEPRLPALLPEDTFLYYGGYMAAGSMDAIRSALAGMGGGTAEEFDEAMQMFEQQYGFDLDADLMTHIEGEMGIALFPSSEGLLAEQSRVPMGFVAMFQTNDPPAVSQTVDDFTAKIREQGAPVEEVQAGDFTLYGISDSSMGGMIVVYGVAKEYLTLGSSGQVVKEMFTDKNSLAKSADFKNAMRALPGKAIPMLYVDLDGLLGAVRESMSGYSLESFNESMAFLDPIPTIVMGYEPSKGDIIHVTLVVFVEH
jgi:hypothetical protein